MKKQRSHQGLTLGVFPLSLLSLTISSEILAQAEEPNIEIAVPSANVAGPIEEVQVIGRLKSSATDLVFERMESETVVDIIGGEQIARIGDSTVAAALKRVPGVTLVDGKFVYVRGLGERYSSAILNGATVPSPDLTRNVIPLDIFPSSILESVAIQKGFTADMPAAFGGGNIDIRTKGMPESFVFSMELSSGVNSDSGDRLSYGSGNDEFGSADRERKLSGDIDSALRTYRTGPEASEGSLSPLAIQRTLGAQGMPITLDQAKAINAELATGLYRDLDIKEENESLNDLGASISLGNLFSLGGAWELGLLGDLNYDTSSRSDERISRTFDDPEEEFGEQFRTTDNVSITGAFNAGLRWGDDHIVESKNLFIRNTDDEVSRKNEYGQSTPFSGGRGRRVYDYKFEQRELEIYQITGSHTLGFDTKDLLGIENSFFDDLTLEWFYSDSTATTDIPSETSIQGALTRDTQTDDIISTQVSRSNRMLNVRYTDLEDEVDSSGFELTLPVEVGSWQIELSGGGKYDKKLRTYRQLDLSVGTTSSAVDGTLSRPLSSVFSDENITNPDFDYELLFQNGLSRSYIAATMTDAYYGELDLLWNDTWRFVVGARYEDYKQFSSPWQPYRANGSPLQIKYRESDGLPEGVFQDDDVYGSLALTYIRNGFWAEDFQLRFAMSETIVRPDLREISPSSFRDPLNDDLLLEGNPDAVPSDLTNYDVRGEWFFSNGDSFTVSLFYKDIKNPIEYYTNPGSETTNTARIENAASGSTQGVEVEWLKSLDFAGDFASQFYVSGNVTLAESELVTGDDITVSATNRTRPLQGASEYVANIQLGFDSNDSKHAATLVYNVFGERIFAAGISGQPDEYEQPFNALDLSYSYYLNDNFTFKFKARNLLDESVLITKGDVNLYERTIGQSFSLSVKYAY